MPAFPQNLVNAGTPEGTAAPVTLPEDAWDMLGLGGGDGVTERAMAIKNGQVALVTAGDWFSGQQNYALEQRDAQRNQWQYEAEQRLARLEEKKAAHPGLKLQKFTWSKDGQKAFEWRKLYHALTGPAVAQLPEGGLITEAVISSTSMRMYCDHRVMGTVVLPGVSHVSLFAATGSMGIPSPSGVSADWHMSVKETLFERPYIVNSGAELIAAIAAGKDPGASSSGTGGMAAAIVPVGVPMTYCRCTSVTKERGQIKPVMDWAN